MSALPSRSIRLQAVDYDPFSTGELVTTAPSSEPQKEVWTAARMGPDASCAYNESFTLELHGALDVDALQRALTALAERHEALHSTFSPDGETLCVSGSASLKAEEVDLRGLPDSEREARLGDLRRREVEEPFDLEHGPLVRARLARVEDDHQELIVTTHHIVCDGWSTAVLIRELRDLYGGLREGRKPDLAPAPRFSDYARAEAERLADPGDEEYWVRQFAGSIPVLDVPPDRPRGAVRTYASRRYDHVVDHDLLSALESLARLERTSLFSVLFATFTAYLCRLTGENDIVVGVPAAGQASPGWNGLVGHCVNLLPMRILVDGAQPFTRHLARARATVLDAFEHKDYTFGRLLKRLPVARDPGRAPLVSVMFNLDQAMDGDLRFPDLDVAFRSNPRHFENFELFVNAVQSRGVLILECQYNTHLFDEASIRSRMAGYETLLRAVARDPRERVVSLPVMTPDELRTVVSTWNETREEVPEGARVQDLVSRQAQRVPDKVAVRGPGGSGLSYRDLDRRSARLGRYLGQVGVGPGSHVAVALSRSPDLLVGLLAILKAGGAYVPLDPEYPTRRLSFMIEDAGVDLLLTEERLLDRLPDSRAPVMCLDSEAHVWDRGPDGGFTAPGADPGAAAYVIYTSGSTGRPKGVAVRHSAVVNFLSSMAREPGLGEDDVLVAVTTVSFDISNLELFLPLATGARVVLADDETARDPTLLMRLLEESGATVLQATPATWQMLVDAGWSGGPGFKALCGGEALPSGLARELAVRAGEAWNLYGPTETTIWSTRHRLDPADGTSVPIGRPIGNTRVYLVDDLLRPVPVGVPGELCIAGAGVAIGYLDRPDATAERFVPDPTDPDGGARMYRTGDLARYRRDGVILFERRVDTQVKVRGFRIELGEIDTSLMEHPSIALAATVAVTATPGDTRLVAYYVARSDEEPAPSDLRAFLGEGLPAYMIPQSFVRLDALPRTLNGKVDRKALQALEPRAGRASVRKAPPRTELERMVAAIWEDVLGVEGIGPADDFFELGGHSILAVRVSTQLGKELGMEVPLRRIMATPMLGDLARHLETARQLREVEASGTESDAHEEVVF